MKSEWIHISVLEKRRSQIEQEWKSQYGFSIHDSVNTQKLGDDEQNGGEVFQEWIEKLSRICELNELIGLCDDENK